MVEEEDEGRRGPMEAADSAVDRRAAEATADKGRQESGPTRYRIPRKGREQGKEEAALPAGGRKRRVEDEETSETRGKSPRGDEEEEGLFDYNEERDGVGEVSGSDEDMLGQD